MIENQSPAVLEVRLPALDESGRSIATNKIQRLTELFPGSTKHLIVAGDHHLLRPAAHSTHVEDGETIDEIVVKLHRPGRPQLSNDDIESRIQLGFVRMMTSRLFQFPGAKAELSTAMTEALGAPFSLEVAFVGSNWGVEGYMGKFRSSTTRRHVVREILREALGDPPRDTELHKKVLEIFTRAYASDTALKELGFAPDQTASAATPLAETTHNNSHGLGLRIRNVFGH